MDIYLLSSLVIGLTGVVISVVMLFLPRPASASEPLRLELQKLGVRLEGETRGFALVLGLVLMGMASFLLMHHATGRLDKEREALRTATERADETKQRLDQALRQVQQHLAVLELNFPEAIDVTTIPKVRIVIDRQPGPEFVPVPLMNKNQAKVDAHYSYPPGARLAVVADVPGAGKYRSPEFQLSHRSLDMTAAQ